MGRKKKPVDIVKELGKLSGADKSGKEYLSFIEENYKKFNTIPKAETLLWNMNISIPDKHPTLYRKIYDHTGGYKFKNPLTVKRHLHLGAFLMDHGLLKPD